MASGRESLSRAFRTSARNRDEESGDCVLEESGSGLPEPIRRPAELPPDRVRLRSDFSDGRLQLRDADVELFAPVAHFERLIHVDRGAIAWTAIDFVRRHMCS